MASSRLLCALVILTGLGIVEMHPELFRGAVKSSVAPRSCEPSTVISSVQLRGDQRTSMGSLGDKTARPGGVQASLATEELSSSREILSLPFDKRVRGGSSSGSGDEVEDSCSCTPDQGPCSAVKCRGRSSVEMGTSFDTLRCMETGPPPTGAESAGSFPPGSSVSSSGWAFGDISAAMPGDGSEGDMFADMRVRLRAAAREIKRRAELRAEMASADQQVAGGGLGDDSADWAGGADAPLDVSGMSAECVVCRAEIAPSGEWVMAGDAAHCSVACAERTAEVFIDGLQSRDGALPAPQAPRTG